MKRRFLSRVWEVVASTLKDCFMDRSCPVGRVCRAGMDCPAGNVCVKRARPKRKAPEEQRDDVSG